MRVDALEIDDSVLAKIESRHGVTFGEVRDACLAAHRQVRRGREGLYKLFSRTEAGRYLLVVLAHSHSAVWRVVTARDMTVDERRLYRREMER